MATFESLLTTFPESAKARGDAFERLAKWYLENSPTYSAVIKRAWLWNDWPGRFGRDAGIDLVAETRDGQLWAIQAKAYSPTSTITKQDVDSFLSESARKRFSFRLLLATTDLIGPNARNVFGGQMIPASFRLLSDLAAEPLDWPHSIDELRPATRTPATPRPHQTEALNAIVQRLSKGGRGRVTMACGTGKTFVQLWAHERLASRRTLVLVPSLFLVQQSLHEWTANRRRPFEFLCVCSDDTVVDHDSFVSNVTEMGIPVTTDPTKIQRFLLGNGDRVLFSTYQSSPCIAEAMRGTSLQFDLVLADEAHRLAGATSRGFSTSLRDEAIPAQRRVFFTATPRYLTGKAQGTGDKNDLEVISMDDEAVFGPEIHRLSFGEAIGQALLSDYQVVVVGVSDKEALQLAKEGTIVAFKGKKTDARTLARQIGLAKAMHDFKLRRVISFHSRVNAARDFAADLQEIIRHLPAGRAPEGNLIFDHVSGEMPTGERRTRINRLRDVDDNQHALLANARCLSEGVDVPSIDGVAFVDPRGSQVEIVQAVGRAIRLSADKKLGTIVIPVFVPDGEDVEKVLADSAFEPVWAVVRALRDHDEDLADRLDQARRKLGIKQKCTTSNLPPKIILDLPVEVVGRSFLAAFTARLIEKTTSVWEVGFAHLEAFVVRESSALVPSAFKTNDGFPLGMWVSNQRAAFGKHTLSAERTARLKAIPGWQWDAFEAKWEENFRKIQKFALAVGHTIVPKKLEQQYLWARTQRDDYRKRRLPQERIIQLAALPGWSWEPAETKFDAGLAALRRFVTRANHARVPPKHEEDGYPLGQWVSKQRAAFRKKKLSRDRVTTLASVPGWTWDHYEWEWQQAYKAARQYAAREGNARIPSDHREDNVNLGEWAGAQRDAHSKGELSPDRQHDLNALPGWLWKPVKDERWWAAFERLQRYKKNTGHVSPPAEYRDPDEFRLGSWVAKQRVKPDDLTLERRKALDDLGFVWDRFADKWRKGYEALCAYAKANHDADVPQRFVDEKTRFGLGSWVQGKRKAFAGKALSADKIAALKRVPGWIWGHKRRLQKI